MTEIVGSVRDSVKPYAPLAAAVTTHPTALLARNISLAHAGKKSDAPRRRPKQVVGITGSPGAGK